MRRHAHIWEDVYDDVPYGMGTAALYGGIACIVCGDWYEEWGEEREGELDEDNGEE
jgi:hypothetical protein